MVSFLKRGKGYDASYSCDFIEPQYSLRMEMRLQLLYNQNKLLTMCMWYHTEGAFLTPCKSNVCVLSGGPAATTTGILETITTSLCDRLRNVLHLISLLWRYIPDAEGVTSKYLPSSLHPVGQRNLSGPSPEYGMTA